MTRAAALPFAAVLAVAYLASSALAGSGTHTFEAPGAIGSISASGSSVAIHVGDGVNLCTPAMVWNASTGAVTKLKDPCTSDATFQNLTLAGTTPIWWDESAGIHVYCDDVYASSHALGICDGTEGDTFYEFGGDRTVTAISDYSVCDADCTGANGQLLPDGNYGVEVRRLVGRKVVALLKPVDFRLFLDARNWRVASIEPRSRLTVWDTSGRPLWSLPGVTGVYAGAITGNSVVIHQLRTLRVYSKTGPGPARPVPKGATLEGTAGGLALYDVGSTVRVLRLSDGRDRRLVAVRGLAGSQITPAGAFYAAGRAVTLVRWRQCFASFGNGSIIRAWSGRVVISASCRPSPSGFS
ncbi:MAG TPA: hypothetical protein VHS03_09840, partial [Gaiellaceae bacterium]|nr:hypothetical protein [Gaiellaceae bacterium]